jgi:LacI family transcriptional regulator, fructose operon transcriptional repressor
MIIPEHDNRFFASLSHAFEAGARDRGLVPVIASTLRDPGEEQRVVGTLISYAVEYLFVAGATDPAAIHDQCRTAGLRHVFVDLPGIGAPSVTSDNHAGAAALTQAMLADRPRLDDSPRGRIHFLGGIAEDHATRARIAGFRATMAAAGRPAHEDQIIPCGYAPGDAAAALAALCDRLGGLPAGVFVNSLTVFEGALQHFVRLAPDALTGTVFGCYDYEPLGTWLQFPVHMVRQNAPALIARAYQMIEADLRDPVVEEITPDLIPPRATV